LIDINDILPRLKKLRKCRRGWLACCPAHEDRSPSFQIWVDNGRIGVKCYAGCPRSDIFRALGISDGKIGKPQPLPAWSAARRAEERAKPRPPFADMARGFTKAITPELTRELASELGVSATSLRRLHLGRMQNHLMPVGDGDFKKAVTAWVFPMRNGQRAVVGLGLRSIDGGKFRHTGSDGHGLFIPDGLVAGADLYCPEGPTSLAALLTIGLGAVGRPNNELGSHYLTQLCYELKPRRVFVVGDNDLKPDGRWPGRQGAESVQRHLIRHRAAPYISVLMPPEGIKDSRDWLRAWRREMGPAAVAAIHGWIEKRTGRRLAQGAVA